MDVGSSIKKIRTEHGLTQVELGEITGVSGFAVSQWENGRAVPRMGAIQKMSDYFGVPKSVIMGDKKPIEPEGWVKVPLYGRIAAGDPLEMDAVDDWGMVPAPIADRYPGCFLLVVEGESMNRILPNGCLAVVDRRDTVDASNKPYAVCVNGYDATIKRVRRLDNGFELSPDSDDPTFKPRVYDAANPDDDTITVIGEVVYYVLPFDWEF